MRHRILVATATEVLCIDPGAIEALPDAPPDVSLETPPDTPIEAPPDAPEIARADGLQGRRPTGLASDAGVSGRAWCCTSDGVFRSDDGGLSWVPAGLEGERLMSIAPSPARRDLLWAGTEPSRVWCSEDAGSSWRMTADPTSLPSSPGWAFPPRPETHHVRWIAPHPSDSDRLWVAIEAGALIRTEDGGRSWIDRVPGGPYDTHELAIHPEAAEVLRVAAGDGYYESRNGGEAWTSPMEGFDVGYLRSVAVDPGDPEVVLVSASSSPRTAYGSGSGDGRIYRREGSGEWRRVSSGWPEPPQTMAPLLLAGSKSGELWAADERGVHRSEDGGTSWRPIQRFDPPPHYLRGIALVGIDLDD